MSEKKRRDITLGEMQDECKRVKGLCVDGCKFIDVCPNRCDVETRPSKWDLSDPPRFNEAQMALLKALYALGVAELEDDPVYDQIIMLTPNGRIGGFKNTAGIPLTLHGAETLDLAEMFGKERPE